MLGSLILYLKGMRTTMFQLSGFYCRGICKGTVRGSGLRGFGVLQLGALGFWCLGSCSKVFGVSGFWALPFWGFRRGPGFWG